MSKGKMATQQEQIDELNDALDEILLLNAKMVQALKMHQDLIERLGFVVMSVEQEA